MPEIEEDSAEEAIAAIQKLHLYEEQQMEGSPAFIREMERHEHVGAPEIGFAESTSYLKLFFMLVDI